MVRPVWASCVAVHFWLKKCPLRTGETVGIQLPHFDLIAHRQHPLAFAGALTWTAAAKGAKPALSCGLLRGSEEMSRRGGRRRITGGYGTVKLPCSSDHQPASAPFLGLFS